MNILIVSSRYFPEVGAAPVRITNMAKGLHRMGHSVDVLTCLPSYPQNRIYEGYRHRFSTKEVLDGITVYRYWSYVSNSKNAFRRGLSMLSFSVTLWAFAFHFRNLQRYDRIIIQTPDIIPASSAMSMFKCLLHKKVILNVSDLWPLSGVVLEAMKTTSLSFKYMSGLEKFLYRKGDCVMGQSNEILTHVMRFFPDRKTFLFRNMQPDRMTCRNESHRRHNPLKIVYAGLLGYAQDVLSLVESVRFRELGAEFYIYGAGGQLDLILKGIETSDDSVFYKGVIPKENMPEVLADADVSVIPMKTPIYGAVPSKLYELVSAGVPVLFCCVGEGAAFVTEYGCGLVSNPGDYEQLASNIRRFAAMPDEEYGEYIRRCVKCSETALSYEDQMNQLNSLLIDL